MCHKSLNKLPAVLAITVSCMGLATTSKSSAQGLFKRLQDRVQTLDQSRSPDASQTKPDANPSRSEPRRPLLDKLLQNGSELFSGVDGERQASPFSPGTESWIRPPGNVFSTPGDMGNGLASLGIEVVESARGVPGVLVTGFSPDSRADDAGLRKNDVIVSLDQTLTTKIADVANFLSQRRPGQVVSARVLRGDRLITLQIPLSGRPAAGVPQMPSATSLPRSNVRRFDAPDASVPGVVPLPPPPALGNVGKSTAPSAARSNAPAPESPAGDPVAAPQELLALPRPDLPNMNAIASTIEMFGIIPKAESRLRGTVVEGVVHGSAADIAGLMPADRLVAVNGFLIRNQEDLSKRLSSLAPQGRVSFGLVRGGAYLTRKMKLTTEIKEVTGVSADQVADGSAGKQENASREKTKPENGVLEGIGSVLGGLFSGSQRPGAVNKTEQQRKLQGGLKSESESGESSVRPTSFDRVASDEDADTQLPALANDPPSLKEMQPTPGQLSEEMDRKQSKKQPVNSEKNDQEDAPQTAAEMREQIRQLQKRLRMLEEDSSGQKKPASKDDQPKDKNLPN